MHYCSARCGLSNRNNNQQCQPLFHHHHVSCTMQYHIKASHSFTRNRKVTHSLATAQSVSYLAWATFTFIAPFWILSMFQGHCVKNVKNGVIVRFASTIMLSFQFVHIMKCSKRKQKTYLALKSAACLFQATLAFLRLNSAPARFVFILCMHE